MTISGRFRDVDQGSVANLAVHIGDHVVHTDRRGRFEATVRPNGPVLVRMDESTDSGVVEVWADRPDTQHVFLTTQPHEDCH
jgi:hypothetical protein